MHTIKLSLHPIRDGEVVSATILKQRKRNDYWVNEEVIAFNSNEPGAERQVLLEDNQRIVVEGSSNVAVVYDKEQRAAVPRPAGIMVPVSTPVNTDGDESPSTPADELAMKGDALQQATAQELRDKAISMAREKLKEQQQEKERPPNGQPAGRVEAHSTEPGMTVSSVPPAPKKDDKAPVASVAKPSWPPSKTGGAK